MEEGIVHAAFVDVQDPCGPLSPETSEFINLERQLIMDEPNFIIGQQSPVPNIPTVQHNSSRKSSEIQREMEAEEQSRQLLQSELEEKLEERKRSMELGSSENGLQLMERRQFRQFSRYRKYRLQRNVNFNLTKYLRCFSYFFHIEQYHAKYPVFHFH